MNHGREDQNPWSKWYWQDWEADTGLRACSLAAQGLWMRMLSIMARSKKKGYLLDGEKQMGSKTLAKLTGEAVEVIDALVDELFTHGVPSKSEDGIIFNRRMSRESALSEIRAECGRMKGKRKSKRQAKSKQNKSKDVLKVEANGQGPSASVSVYASASASKSLEEGECGGAEINTEFNQFWNAYPLKEGKQDALREFRKLRSDGVPLDEIAAGVNGYLDMLRHERIKNNFNRRPKLAATLLRNGRWKEYADFKYQPPL